MSRVLYAPEQDLLAFVERKIGMAAPFAADARAIGWGGGWHIEAAAVFFRFETYDCEVAFAVDGRRWFDPAFAHAAFAYPFWQLGLERITCDVAAADRRARALARMLGFQPEGRKRRLDRNDDRLIYGLLRTECRWLAPGAWLDQASPVKRASSSGESAASSTASTCGR